MKQLEQFFIAEVGLRGNKVFFHQFDKEFKVLFSLWQQEGDF